MNTFETTISHGKKTATITERNGEWLYNVWDPKKGFVASGFRKTEADAIKAATVVLKAKG